MLTIHLKFTRSVLFIYLFVYFFFSVYYRSATKSLVHNFRVRWRVWSVRGSKPYSERRLLFDAVVPSRGRGADVTLLLLLLCNIIFSYRTSRSSAVTVCTGNDFPLGSVQERRVTQPYHNITMFHAPRAAATPSEPIALGPDNRPATRALFFAVHLHARFIITPSRCIIIVVNTRSARGRRRRCYYYYVPLPLPRPHLYVPHFSFVPNGFRRTGVTPRFWTVASRAVGDAQQQRSASDNIIF